MLDYYQDLSWIKYYIGICSRVKDYWTRPTASQMNLRFWIIDSKLLMCAKIFSDFRRISTRTTSALKLTKITHKASAYSLKFFTSSQSPTMGKIAYFARKTKAIKLFKFNNNLFVRSGDWTPITDMNFWSDWKIFIFFTNNFVLASNQLRIELSQYMIYAKILLCNGMKWRVFEFSVRSSAMPQLVCVEIQRKHYFYLRTVNVKYFG